MGIQDLFPQPQQLTLLGGTIELAGRALLAQPPLDCPPFLRVAIERLETESGIEIDPAASAYRLVLRLDPNDPAFSAAPSPAEAYRLELREQQGELVAAAFSGLFVGCQTLRQLWQGQPGSLPSLRIADWPDFRYRGLYVESKWGPDLMSLADWKAMIDYMAALKFNSLGIGVYGCWIVQYGGRTTEFMMLPFPEHPALATPKTLRYFSPARQAWQTLEYLPAMAVEDFFGELVDYARQSNITVRPHFNSPGHNTLIPRAYPDVSAKDEAGKPIGYGFCLSNPRTYEILFSLYDSIIDRYLRPHQVDWFHIGLDEVTGYMGIDPGKPFEVLEPWCQCPECRAIPHGRQLQLYAIKVCAHLKQRGINHITLWNDALESLGALDAEFVQQLDAAGLRGHVVLQWWRYHEPVLVPRSELGLRAWVTPMAGYWPNLFTQSYTSNIYPMLLFGHRAGAEGTDAYCIFDPAFDRNYVCLAQYAWNQSSSEDLYQFKSRYARATLGRWLPPALAIEAFEKYDQVFDSTAWTETVLASLLNFWHTYPAARRRGAYPANVLADLADDRLRLRAGYERSAANARAARDLFAVASQQSPEPIWEQYRAECNKVVGLWAAFSSLGRACECYRQASQLMPVTEQAASMLARASAEAHAAHEHFLAVMADLEQVKATYLRPQILRDLSVALLYPEYLQTEMDQLAEELRAGGVRSLPTFEQLQANQIELDPFVSTAVEAHSSESRP